MKRWVPITAALFAFVLGTFLFGHKDLLMALPPPFNFVTNGGYVAADAGYFGDLTVLGTCTGCGGGAGGGVIADAGNFVAVSVDGGFLELDNQYDPGGVGPCYGVPDSGYCVAANSYSWFGEGIWLHNTAPQITLCNTSIPNYPWDGGQCANIYQNTGGLLEINALPQNGVGVQTACQFDLIQDGLSCSGFLKSNGIVATSNIQFAVSVPETTNYVFEPGKDPLSDGGFSALFLFSPATGGAGTARNLYFNDPSETDAYGFNFIDFHGVKELLEVPYIPGLMVDGGSFQNVVVTGPIIEFGQATIFGAISVDAGYYNYLNVDVNGSAVIPLLTGQTIVDGGMFISGQVIVDGGAVRADGIQASRGGGMCFGEDDATSAYGWGSGPCDADGRFANSNAVEYWDTSNYTILTPTSVNFDIGGVFRFQMSTSLLQTTDNLQVTGTSYLRGPSEIAGSLGMDAGSAATFQIGAAGTTLTNIGLGTCTLSSGTCNAAIGGVTGNSLCYCDIQGGNWAIDAGSFTCHARADAGSATVWVQAGVTALPGTPTIGIHCDN